MFHRYRQFGVITSLADVFCPFSMVTSCPLDVNGLPDRHTSYKNRYQWGFKAKILYSNAAALKKPCTFFVHGR